MVRRIEDRRIERLIKKHLSRGFVLLEQKSCPACHNPLVRQEQQHHQHASGDRQDDDDDDAQAWPIPGIPYCVKCDAHVVSQLSDVNILDAYEKRHTNASLFVASQTSNDASSGTGNSRSKHLPTKQQQQPAKAASEEGRSSHQHQHSSMATTSDSSGILEREDSKEFSLTSITPRQAHRHPAARYGFRADSNMPTTTIHGSSGSRATIVRTEPSIRGSLIVDPVPEDHHHFHQRRYYHEQQQQQQRVVLLSTTPTLVEMATQTSPPPQLWERQQEQARRVLQAHGGGRATPTVETTSEASAMSGRRQIPVQEGIVVTARDPSSSNQPRQFVEKAVYVVDAMEVSSSSRRSGQSSIVSSQRTSTESVVVVPRPRDPPRQQERAAGSMSSWKRDDEESLHSLATKTPSHHSIKDPPSCQIVAANSYHEQEKAARPYVPSSHVMYGQPKVARDPSERAPSQTDPPIPKPLDAVPEDSTRTDEGDSEQQERAFVTQETPRYNNTVKTTLQKPVRSYTERPATKPVPPASSFDSFEPIQEEKPCIETTEEDHAEENGGIEITVGEDDGMMWSVADATVSLNEFAANAPRVSMHPRETLLTEQINAHNKDILREAERLEHLHKMKHDSEHHEEATNTEIHKEITKSIKSAIRAKTYSEAKVRQLQDERSKLEADRILSFLEEELKEKQNEATMAEKLAKDAYERLNKAREKAMLSISAETYHLEEAAHDKASQNISLHEEDDSTQAHSRGETTAFDERWELLREEGRSALTRRLMAGWRVSPHQCKGAECHKFPLLYHEGQSYCAVCAGTGSGQDGAYDISLLDESVAVRSKSSEESAKTKSDDDQQAGSLATKSLKAIQDEFDAKRKLASKEIGVRMRRGWMLLDLTCNTCMMPLLTDMFQECTLCVLCGVQSGHVQSFLDEKKANDPNQEARPISVIEKTSSSVGYADEQPDGSEKRGIRFEEDHEETNDELSREGTNHSLPSAMISARSNRSDPPPSWPYSDRRPISPDGRRQEERLMQDRDQARNDINGRRSAAEVIVVEDADSLMAEAARRLQYASASRQTLVSTRGKNTKQFLDRPTSPEYSVASAPQYGNPSSLVATSYDSWNARSQKTPSRFDPQPASRMRSDRLNSDTGSSKRAHSAVPESRYSRNGKQGQDWSARSVGSSRSHTYRAPSPGLSAVRLPSAASTVYTGTSRVHKSILQETHRPRMYPEKWAGSTEQHDSPNGLSRAAPHRPQTNTTSFRPIRPSHGSRSPASDVIDVEPMRRWQVGREDVILVGSRRGKERQHDEKGLEDLLRRIEKTKFQLEERSQASASKDVRLQDLVENLVRSAQQLREIENRS